MRRLRMGMIGGGPGAFIGPIHRIAAEMDREIELVAGVFSSSPDKSREAGGIYRIDSNRAYSNLDQMFESEAGREDGIDFVSIVSPNYHHLPAALAAFAARLPVICDKPATATLGEAQELARHVAASGQPYALTHVYSGYPLVREARTRIADGALGIIRKVVVEYPQGWLAGAATGKQSEWRVDPKMSGPGGCIGDIGTHAFQLAEFVTGLRVTEIFADLGTVVPGRKVDDDCTVLLRFENGARGVLLASQIEIGEMNGLRIRVYGHKAGLVWRQETPNSLIFHTIDGRSEIVHAGGSQLGREAMACTRTPTGHPEGFLEAFANIYRDFAAVLRGEAAPLLPGIETALRGMTFIDISVTASRDRSGWVPLIVSGEQA